VIAVRVRVVQFRLSDGVSHEEYLALASSVAPAFAEWDGLVSKVWLHDPVGDTYGGVYLFSSAKAADASRETELFRAMVANPSFRDVSIQEHDVLTPA